MFVYKMTVHKSVINAFDPTKLFSEEDYDFGLFSNKKKADQAFVKLCDDEIDWWISCNEKVEVESSWPKDYKVRIEIYEEIIWFVGKIEKIKVQ